MAAFQILFAKKVAIQERIFSYINERRELLPFLFLRDFEQVVKRRFYDGLICTGSIESIQFSLPAPDMKWTINVHYGDHHQIGQQQVRDRVDIYVDYKSIAGSRAIYLSGSIPVADSVAFDNPVAALRVLYLEREKLATFDESFEPGEPKSIFIKFGDAFVDQRQRNNTIFAVMPNGSNVTFLGLQGDGPIFNDDLNARQISIDLSPFRVLTNLVVSPCFFSWITYEHQQARPSFTSPTLKFYYLCGTPEEHIMDGPRNLWDLDRLPTFFPALELFKIVISGGVWTREMFYHRIGQVARSFQRTLERMQEDWYDKTSGPQPPVKRLFRSGVIFKYANYLVLDYEEMEDCTKAILRRANLRPMEVRFTEEEAMMRNWEKRLEDWDVDMMI